MEANNKGQKWCNCMWTGVEMWIFGPYPSLLL
jgi:hypothetical protein